MNSFIGFGKLFLSGVEVDTVSGTIPESVFQMFQLTFAIITPALMVGAFAERMRFSAMMLFMALWLTVVYAPVAHWVWGGGFLGEMGVMDFAGGTVVHINAGVAGLVCLGYPFHPPGRPEKTRTEHLADLRTPALILQGERDRFGTPGDVAGYELSASITVEWLPDGDHDLAPRKRSGRTLEQNWNDAVEAIAGFVAARR